MFEICRYSILRLTKSKITCQKPWLYLTVAGIVTVLLFEGTLCGAVSCNDINKTDLCLFEFKSEFFVSMGRFHLDGFMACNGPQYRIAVYWFEPAIMRDMTVYLPYCDFIFSRGAVYYWIHGALEPVVYDWSDSDNDSLLPEGDSVESAVRSALAVLNRMRSEPTTDVPLELGKFFEQSRNREKYSDDVLPDEMNNNKPPSATVSDVQILNALPYGREYVKYKRSDGVLEWGARRSLNDQPVVRLAVKSIPMTQTDDIDRLFDPNTLGQWTLIPDSYKDYWSFDSAYRELKEKDAEDQRTAGCALADRLESYLDTHLDARQMPPRVWRALNRLWFKTALIIGQTERLSRSAQAAVDALCDDVSVSKYHALRELSSMAGQIWKYQPEQGDELIQPLIKQVLKHVGSDTPQCLSRLMISINLNGWFDYGSLLLEEARRQNLVEKDLVDALSAKLETSRLSRGTKAPASDPSESSASVKQYLLQLDANPPRGTLTMDDVHHILTQGIAQYGGDEPESTVEDVVLLIRLIVGEGPFRGDQAQLIESIERFSRVYFVVCKNKEPINTILATFLALSFCDISTAQDHQVLLDQIRTLSAESQSQINTLFAEQGLDALVSPNDVKSIFSESEQQFREYVHDPLWPTFKFPLTSNEQTRLLNNLKQRFSKSKSLFQEMSQKVRYGGPSKQLKDKTLFAISSVASGLLSETAFIRRPSYPGVLCQYRGKHGFAAVIRGPLYINGNRPKEKFKAMKYFHMGHRIEEVVKRERELARANHQK